MKTRLIERVYPDRDLTKFYLVEVKPSGFADDMNYPDVERKPDGIVIVELWNGTLAEVQAYATKEGLTLPPVETWVYPDWPDNIEYWM